MKQIFFFLTVVLITLGASCTQKARTSSETRTENTNATTAVNKTVSTLLIPGQYADVDVVHGSDNTWRMYFGVEPEILGTQFEVYTATSSDGFTWVKEDAAVLTHSTFPDVVLLGDGRTRLYFQRDQAIHSAIANDGVQFTDEEGERVSVVGIGGAENVAAPTTLLLPDGSYYMIVRATYNAAYSATSINQTSTAFYAMRSTDGLQFTDPTLIVDGRTSLFDGYIDGPELFVADDGVWHLRFWTSAGKENQYNAGQYDMTSTDNGATWSDPKLLLSSRASGIIGGDPVYMNIDGVSYMIYTERGRGIFLRTL